MRTRLPLLAVILQELHLDVALQFELPLLDQTLVRLQSAVQLHELLRVLLGAADHLPYGFPAQLPLDPNRSAKKYRLVQRSLEWFDRYRLRFQDLYLVRRPVH